MRPWFGGYDFEAANHLEATLNQAAGKLRDFLAQRDKWASIYLSYQPKGPQQGWVGQEYNTWAGQFDESQYLLGMYVNELGRKANELNNRSRNEELKANIAPRPLKDYPANAQWHGAPRNTAPDNTEGATPECLYSFAKNATYANDQIRPFFSGTLAAAADAAPAVGGTCSHLAQVITRFLQAEVLVLDARVRIVGEAFEFAGGRPSPGNPGFLTFRDSQQLDNLDNAVNHEAQQIQKAKQLVKWVDQHGMTPYAWSQLKEHQNDPVYTATFFNGLTQHQFRDLLETYGTPVPLLGRVNGPDESGVLVQALVSSYAEGGLDVEVQGQLEKWLDITPNRVRLPFYDGLAKNPRAAANFMAQFQQANGVPLEQYLSIPFHHPLAKDDEQRFANIILAGTVGAENIDPILAAQNVTSLATYYQQNQGIHTDRRIDTVYGKIIEAFGNDVTFSLTSTAPDPHGYLTSPDGLKLTPAQWAAFTQEAMRDGRTAGELLTFAHGQAAELQKQGSEQPGGPDIGNSYEMQAGLIDGFFDYQAKSTYVTLSKESQDEAQNWLDALNTAVGDAAGLAINIISNPGTAAKTIIVAAGQDLEDFLRSAVFRNLKNNPDALPPPHYQTWEDSWSRSVYDDFNSGVQHAIQGNNPSLAELIDSAKGQNFIIQGGPQKGQIIDPSNMNPQQLKAYNAWLMSPYVVQYESHGGHYTAYQAGYINGGDGTASENPASAP